MESSETEPGQNALPLAGWRIIVSRARKQASALAEGLRALGAEVLEIPFIEIRPPRSYAKLDAALRGISGYDWLILTSVNGVEAFFERAESQHVSNSVFAHLKIAAIGPATKNAIERHGLTVEAVPAEYVAESVVETLAEKVRGKRVLLCRAHVARDVIPRELRKLGAQVDVVEAYETVVPEQSREQLRAALAERGRLGSAGVMHAITFTSSSTVHNYVKLLGIRSGKSKLVRGLLNASIGPVTSETLRRYGLTVDVQARQYTIPGLIEALIEHAKAGREVWD
jgi:uroporphyrinogen-III synthase